MYHYYIINCLVKIGNIMLTQVNSINIKQSIETLSDTAELVIPRYYYLQQGGKAKSTEASNIRDFIKEGDVVEIQLGYDGQLATEFQGYVKTISAGSPLRIECEDEMYQLRKGSLRKSYDSVKLAELIKYIVPGYLYEALDMSLGKFVINNSSPYEVLEALRKDYLLFSYFTGKKLNVGFATDIKSTVIHKYHMQRNVRSGHQLEFRSSKDMKLKVIAISHNGNGKQLKAEYGADGGTTRTINFFNKTESELKDLAKKNSEILAYEGFHGSFKGWCYPRCRAGDTVELIDERVKGSELSGKYLTESVTIDLDSSKGIEREIKLSLKV